MTFPCPIVQNSTYYGLQFGSDKILYSERVIEDEHCYSPVISPTTTKLCNKGTHEPTQHAKLSQCDDYSQWSTCTKDQ